MKNKFFIIILCLVGILIRVYPAFKQPLWLDEIYSLYFAHSYSIRDLLINFPDVHPGGLYILLKLLLPITTNIFYLRLILAVIPELIGCFILFKTKPHLTLLVLFMLNPFFIHYSWQLRMYGITFLLTILLYKAFFVSHPRLNIPTIFLIIVSLFFSFELIIPILVYCLYAFVKTRQKVWLSFYILIPLFFVFLKGISSYKAYTEMASWISLPSFTNIPSILLTSFGLRNDINNLNPLPLGYCFLFYPIFFIVVYYLSKKTSAFLYGFTLPLLATLFVSFTFPILSQHFFFYRFIPKVSLMLPRFILPLVLVFFLELQQFLNKKTLAIFIPIILILWIKPNILVNYYSYYNSSLPIRRSDDTLILPPWENLRLNQNFTRGDLERVSESYDTSLVIEKYIVNFNSNPNCQPLKKYPHITYIDQHLSNLNTYQNHTKQILLQCFKSL